MSIKKLDKYKASAKPYAFLPGSFEVTGTHTRPDGTLLYSVKGSALWFGRSNGRRTVAIGTLGASITDPDYETFLREFEYGRYGGQWEAKWDGGVLITRLGEPIEQHYQRRALLAPILDNFPDLPEGWDGWYDIREEY